MAWIPNKTNDPITCSVEDINTIRRRRWTRFFLSRDWPVNIEFVLLLLCVLALLWWFFWPRSPRVQLTSAEILRPTDERWLAPYFAKFATEATVASASFRALRITYQLTPGSRNQCGLTLVVSPRVAYSIYAFRLRPISGINAYEPLTFDESVKGRFAMTLSDCGATERLLLLASVTAMDGQVLNGDPASVVARTTTLEAK